MQGEKDIRGDDQEEEVLAGEVHMIIPSIVDPPQSAFSGTCRPTPWNNKIRGLEDLVKKIDFKAPNLKRMSVEGCFTPQPGVLRLSMSIQMTRALVLIERRWFLLQGLKSLGSLLLTREVKPHTRKCSRGGNPKTWLSLS